VASLCAFIMSSLASTEDMSAGGIDGEVDDDSGSRTMGVNETFFEQTKRFFECRKLLRNRWADLHSTILTEVREISCCDDGSRQQNIHGNNVENLDELYQAARVVNDQYQVFLTSMLSELAIDPLQLRGGILKGEARAAEKAMDDYSNRSPGPSVSWLFDIVRASVYCESQEEILTIIDYLISEAMSTTDAAYRTHTSGLSFKLMRLKNRFRTPTAGGFRDITMNIRIRSMGHANECFEHMCELQLHYRPLTEYGRSLNSHEVYSYFRKYFRGSETSVESRLALLEEMAKDDADMLNHNLREMVDDAIDSGDVGRLRNLKVLLELMDEVQFALAVQQTIVCLLESVGVVEDSLQLIHELNDLGLKQQAVGNFLDARTTLERARIGYEHHLGSLHPKTLCVLNDLGCLATETGDHAVSYMMCSSAHAGLKKMYGFSNEYCLRVLGNVGNALLQMGHTEQAKGILETCLIGVEALRGVNNPHALKMASNLAATNTSLGDFGTALVLSVRAVEGFERLYGPDHSVTLGMVLNLG
jgi:hypothetical protein